MEMEPLYLERRLMCYYFESNGKANARKKRQQQLYNMNQFFKLLFIIVIFEFPGRVVSHRKSCTDLMMFYNVSRSGMYDIDVDGDGPLLPFQVECDMAEGNDPYQVWTIVHHDSEKATNVRGMEASGSYSKIVHYYKATERHLETLIDFSYSCQQYIKWACKGSMFGFWYPTDIDSWWVGRKWKDQYYWGGAETDSRLCGCHPYCYPTHRNSTCNCDANLKLKWLEDSGLLLDSSRLPVLQLRFGDTGEANEAGQHTLGPVKCRHKGHKDVFMGSFTAPFAFESPDFPESYPPPFHRYTWHVKIPQHQAIELVFPEYDVVYWGAYNSVPNCKGAVTVSAIHADETGDRPIVITRQKSSPPYFISDGSEMDVNVTFTTCNQDNNLPTERGFQAEFRRVECVGCDAGLGDNGSTTLCSGPCGVIASYGYPFPHHWYINQPMSYNHTWVLEVPIFHVVELKFNDFEILNVPGSNLCQPNGGMLSIYDGERATSDNLIGQFCDLNRQVLLYSNQEAMTLVYQTRLLKVGNGRGFHATFRSVPFQNAPKTVDFRKLQNVAEGKPTKQSSTMDRRASHLAVDGIDSPLVSVGSCIATNFEKEPWWQVDLQKKHIVYGVEIVNKRRFYSSVSRWPSGRYGMPMTSSGCPSSKDFTWREGVRLQDMTYDVMQDEKVRHWSDGMQLKGGVMKSGAVEQHFCMKIEETSENDLAWMPGEYCIYQYGSACPSGFRSGYIMWVDRQPSRPGRIRSTASGTLPRGEYTPFNTTLYFCCRDDGRPDVPIRLPSDQPFYLFQFGKGCQKVVGMAERQQFFHFNEDLPSDSPSAAEEVVPENIKFKFPHPRIDNTLFEKGLTLYYCYYDITDSLRGFRVLVDNSGLILGSGLYYDNEHYGIVHTVKNSFQSAFSCYYYPIRDAEFAKLRINCSQPISGQFVTIQIFNRYDSLQLSEVKIFAEESCGQPLGMASEEIYDSQLQASSSDDTINHFFTDARLNAPYGWCAAPNDKHKFLQIDLLKPTMVTGVILQGLNDALRFSYVSSFALTFSNDSMAWYWEEEPIGQQKIYKCDQCELSTHTSDWAYRYNLLHKITTRYLKLHILSYNESPCLRMELLGCREHVSCGSTLSAPKGIITSPNHPYYYGQDKSCWWTIEPPAGQHVHLKFVVFDLAPKDNGRKSGRCRDELTVWTGGTEIRSPDGIYFPKLIISKGLMKIHLHSCFRYSISRYRGFYANYKFVDCPGCGMGDFSCPKIHTCKSLCGHIVSIGHPLPYQNNHRCRWLIDAPPSHFINLTFHDFDIDGGPSCLNDYIDFYDGDVLSKENLIGRYCNARHPPQHLVSSWNILLVEFSSDAVGHGRGFSLSYTAQKFQLPPELGDLDFDDPAECPPPWKYYHDHCYNVFQEPETLQWSEAEATCYEIGKGRDGHLVSILDEKEMDVVHYLLTAVWRMHEQSIYIGLKDVLLEGIFRWSDGNPMSYTDWAKTGMGLASQPDGGTFQDCTMLRVDSGHSTAQWHDIPCSLGKHSLMMMDGVMWGDEPQHGAVAGGTVVATVNSFICKMESEQKVGDDNIEPLYMELPRVKTDDYNRVRYFSCNNKELISVIFVCDGFSNCKDGSDEKNCTRDYQQKMFRCTNGHYVSMSVYCDFKDDCGDRSDERMCNHTACSAEEFRCLNGQCIPLYQRCDLRVDCQDRSDEESCGGHCNPNNTFQCYDGTCIPRYCLCDGRRDCPGKYHEDEPAGCFRDDDLKGQQEELNSCANRARRTCHDLYTLDNIHWSGNYLIDPDGHNGPIMSFQVHCNMGDSVDNVQTIVHHDSEHRIYVRSGSDLPGSYSRSIVYDTGLEEMEALIRASESCRQFLKWECMGSRFGFHTEKPMSWWVSRDGKRRFSWGGATRNNTCACFPNCLNLEYPCNCDAVKRFQWSEDSGFITNKNLLPILSVQFGNTYKTGQAGYHVIGPLECSGKVKTPSDNCSSVSHFLQCQSTHYVSMETRCLYEFDQYNYEQGCRDVTHLRNCEDFDCPKHYVKCPDAYCIPIRYLCDGKWDCVEGADEKDCESYHCPGHYSCHNHTLCIPQHELCDGIHHCPYRDDELLCNSSCPTGCSCTGLWIQCRNMDQMSLPVNLPKRLRKLDFSNNKLNIREAVFDSFTGLAELILQNNHLTIVPSDKFLMMINLYFLDLSHNSITIIESKAFNGLSNLKTLNLENNPTLSIIEPGAFWGLTSLPILNLTGMNITVLKKESFKGLDNLSTLVMRDDKIRFVEGGTFLGLKSVQIMDIQGNEIDTFSYSMFDGLKSLQNLYSDSFKFCCIMAKTLPFERCYPSADEISDCEDLMSSPLQRGVIWVLGVVALVGNLFVIVWRLRTRDINPVSSTLILSLGCADLLMGVYLLIIASVDEYHRGWYMQISDQWRRSELCKFCGFLSTVSSEVSVFTLVFITIDRLLCISFPFSLRHFNMQLAYKLIVASWLVACTLAAVPLAYHPYFRGEFYSRSGVCLALHITNQKPPGWQYSVAIFFCINLVAFLIIVSAYGYMYLTIRQSYLSVNRLRAHRTVESRIAQQMGVIVMTNFLCWFPIIMMGLMAMSGMRVPGKAYAWTAVFVLPLNSATNPLIYTIASLRRNSTQYGGHPAKTWANPSVAGREGSNGSRHIGDILQGRSFSEPRGYVSLQQYLKATPDISARDLLHITASVCHRLKELHSSGHALGGMNSNAIFVSSEMGRGLCVYVPDFFAYKINSTTTQSEDIAMDMENLGHLVKQMLRMFHLTNGLRANERYCSTPL